jgi:hypothetical protein
MAEDQPDTAREQEKTGAPVMPIAGDGAVAPASLAQTCNISGDYILQPAQESRRGEKMPALSLAGVPTGRVNFRGVPFQITETGTPQGPCLVAVSGDPAYKLPGTVTIAIDRQCITAYFLHAEVDAPYGGRCGSYTVEYADSSRETITLVEGQEVMDWMILRDNPSCLVGWRGYHRENSQMKGLSIYEWSNPHPEKVKCIVASAAGRDGVLVLAAITLSNNGPFFNDVARGVSKGLGAQICLEQPVASFRRGKCDVVARLFDKEGRPVSGGKVTVSVQGKNFTLEEGKRGAYVIQLRKPSGTQEQVSVVTVSARHAEHAFTDMTGLLYNYGYPRLLDPPYQGTPPQFIVLGVDDIRNIEGTGRLLEIVERLADKGARAAFSLWVTSNLDSPFHQESLERCKMMWQRFYDLGCEICNHSMNHNLNGVNWFAMPTHEKQRREVEGHTLWLRDNIYGLRHIYNFRGGGGGVKPRTGHLPNSS